MAEGPTLRLDRDGAVAVLTIDDGTTRNAFTPALRELLLTEINRIGADSGVRAVVLTGAGPGFCSGGSLRAMGHVTPEEKRASMVRTAELIVTMAELPKPVIAAVHGYAVGAGLSLALACDLVVASAETRFRVGFTAVGLVPDMGAHFFLARALGVHAAKELVWCKGSFDTAWAQEHRLVQLVAAEGASLELALRTARQLASEPTLALAASKRIWAAEQRASLEAVLRAEADASAALRTSADHREGIAALRERRAPRFTGE